jgi:hypothetical protein
MFEHQPSELAMTGFAYVLAHSGTDLWAALHPEAASLPGYSNIGIPIRETPMYTEFACCS